MTRARERAEKIAPVRLQLSRRKGFSLQALSLATNGLPAINVSRSGKWGNPFPIGNEGPLGRSAPDAAGAVGFFRAMLDDTDLWDAAGYPEKIGELSGYNLACWCESGTPCHADVLLELANPDIATAIRSRSDTRPVEEGEA